MLIGTILGLLASLVHAILAVSLLVVIGTFAGWQQSGFIPLPSPRCLLYDFQILASA
jgi:hypothetical protein